LDILVYVNLFKIYLLSPIVKFVLNIKKFALLPGDSDKASACGWTPRKVFISDCIVSMFDSNPISGVKVPPHIFIQGSPLWIEVNHSSLVRISHLKALSLGPTPFLHSGSRLTICKC
jgi:hypothetical protein